MEGGREGKRNNGVKERREKELKKGGEKKGKNGEREEVEG